MKLLFKQRLFSWLDSYDIYDESGAPVYTVEGKLAWGHKLVICDQMGQELGTVQEEIFTFLPRFVLYQNGQEIGEIKKEFTLFKPSFHLDCMDWQITGDFWEWEYQIVNAQGEEIASLSKEVFNWTDTYTLDIHEPENTLMVLMIALAIDAAKCSANS